MFSRIGKARSVLESACTFARWYARRARAAVNVDELKVDSKHEDAEFPSSSRRTGFAKTKRPRENRETANATDATSTPVKKFQPLDSEDKTFSSIMLKVKSRKRREKNDCILLEGKNLIKEALMADLEPVGIFFSRSNMIQDLKVPDTGKLYKIPYRSIQLWSNLTTSPGIVGIFRTPDVTKRQPSENSIPLTFILDNVREPGNLGSILRSAAGIGCEKFIIVRKGCVDLWEPKVLRSACGAHFRLPIHNVASWEEVPEILSDKCAIYIADSNAEVRANRSERNTQFLSSLPMEAWNRIDYTSQEVALVVTGETGEISPDAKDILRSRGIRVTIPLCNEVESLNAAVAISVIGFEIRRQFTAGRKNTAANGTLEE